jgi:replicative DNA helicase
MNDYAEAESLLLGSILLNQKCLEVAADVLVPTDFNSLAHETLFALLLKMMAAGEFIDSVTVPLRVARCCRPEVLGVAYAAELTDRVPAAAAFGTYLGAVLEQSRRRKLLAALRAAGSGLQEPGRTALEVGEAAVAALTAATSDPMAAAGWVPIGTIAAEAIARADRIQSGTQRPGLRTGIAPIDELLGGLQPGDVTVIAARPGAGKSALALQIAELVASTGVGVGVLSLEMAGTQLAGRMLAACSSVPAGKIRDGKLLQSERDRLEDGLATAEGLPLWIDDEPAITGARAIAKIRRLWSTTPSLGLVVIDYVQLLRGDDPRVSREQQLSGISGMIKATAKQCGLPIIVLAQLNRAVDARRVQRPILSDIRECGAIEQDADQVLFLFRPELYDPTDASLIGKAEVIVAKNRHGPTGTADLRWVGWRTRFEATGDARLASPAAEEPYEGEADGFQLEF